MLLKQYIILWVTTFAWLVPLQDEIIAITSILFFVMLRHLIYAQAVRIMKFSRIQVDDIFDAHCFGYSHRLLSYCLWSRLGYHSSRIKSSKLRQKSELQFVSQASPLVNNTNQNHEYISPCSDSRQIFRRIQDLANFRSKIDRQTLHIPDFLLK